MGDHGRKFLLRMTMPMLHAPSPSFLLFLVVGAAPLVNSFLSYSTASTRGVLSNICMVFRENEMENTFRVSLASDFRVDISSSIHGEAETWFLTPIATMLQDGNSEVMKLPEGAKAKRALEKERMERNHVVRLQCIQDGNSLVVTNDCSAHIDAKLVAVLGRIMVQRVAARQQEATKRWTIFLPDENPLKSSNLRGESGVLQLFQSITGTENVEGAEEVVEMVDRNSLPLGMVPRPLMHTFNLLHRGIGLVVAKDASVDCHTPDFPDLYVHRRTDDKRVFPSMYVQESVALGALFELL